MDHNPFITRNNDLFIMLIAGMSILFTTSYVIPMSLQTQFLIVLGFAFLSGFFMSYLYQSLEWALFFMVGIQIVALSPSFISYLTQNDLSANHLIQQALTSSRYSLFLLSSWVVGIPAGFILKKLLFQNYYRRGLF
jgi:hypothetical protein